MSRSGSADVTAGACGTRLQCFKKAITEANAKTTPSVEKVALIMINVAEPDQDVNVKLNDQQLLIAPDADPNLNGNPDFVDALNEISLGRRHLLHVRSAGRRNVPSGARGPTRRR